MTNDRIVLVKFLKEVEEGLMLGEGEGRGLSGGFCVGEEVGNGRDLLRFDERRRIGRHNGDGRRCWGEEEAVCLSFLIVLSQGRL